MRNNIWSRRALAALTAVLLAGALSFAPSAVAVSNDDADAAFDAFIDAYYNPDTKSFYKVSHSTSEYSDFWWEAQNWDLVMDAYERTGSDEHLQLIHDVYDGFTARHVNFDNDYNDDLAWWAQGSARAYALTGDARYLNRAIWLYDRIISERDDTYAGGIWWRNDSHFNKNTATNGPTAITAARLYKATGEQRYLDDAIELAEWLDWHLTVRDRVFDDVSGPGDGVVKRWEFTYNYGNIIGINAELWDITGEQKYLDRANRFAQGALNYRADEDGVFVDEGGGDGGAFKGILARHFAWLATKHGQTQFVPILQLNADTAWSNRRAADNLMGSNWAAPAPAGGIQSSIAASAAIMTQVAPTDDGNHAFPGDKTHLPSTGWIEAEEGVTSLAPELRRFNDQVDFSGSGYLGFWHEEGQAVTFSLSAASAGDHEVVLRYSAAAGDATRRVLVNGVEVAANKQFPGTGSWSVWAETALNNVHLEQGLNTIRIEYNSAAGSEQFLNLDRLQVSRQLEAENGDLTNMGVESIAPGYTGSGYLAGWNAADQWVDLPLTVAAGGTYEVTLRYATGAGPAARTLDVNGVRVVNTLNFTDTGSWSTWSTITVPNVQLLAGDNTLSVAFDPAQGSANWLNLDHVTVRFVHE